MIIDCHCHAGPGDGFHGPWDSDAPLSRFMRWSREAGIDRTIVFPAFHSDYQRANEIVARIVAKNPSRLWGFCFVHAARDKRRVGSMVGRAVECLGLRGIKCHRMDAPITSEVLEAAQRFGVPVLYDPMGEVDAVDLFAPRFPDVTVIIPHLGSFADEWRPQHTMADILARHNNVYADTSGVRRFELLERAVRVAGASKLLFGSDGPWLHPGVELAKIRLMRLSAGEERAMLGGNVLRILGEQPASLAAGPSACGASITTGPSLRRGRCANNRSDVTGAIPTGRWCVGLEGYGG